MLELLKPYWLPIVKWVGTILGLVLFYFKARQDGGAVEKRKQAIEVLKNVQISSKIDNDVAGASNTELDRVLKKFRRD